jgi:hypothetical protein
VQPFQTDHGQAVLPLHNDMQDAVDGQEVAAAEVHEHRGALFVTQFLADSVGQLPR